MMRLPFAWKFGVLVAVTCLGLAGGCLYLFYTISYDALTKQIGKNLLYAGRLGALMFDEEARKAIKRLDQATAQDSQVSAEQVAAMQSGTTMLSLSPESMQRYHESADFQLLMIILRRITAATLQDLEPRDPSASYEEFAREPLKIIENGALAAYLSVTIKESPDRAVTKYLASACPFPAADGWPGNPIGNLTKGWILPPSVSQGKPYVDNQLYTDSFYTSLSAIIPLVDTDGTVLAFLGIDYAATKEKNALVLIRYISIGLVLGSMLLAMACAYFMARRVSASVRRLSQVAQKVADNDLGVRLDIESTDEFSTVGRAFNQMIIAIGKAKKSLDSKQGQLAAIISGLHDRVGTRFAAIAAKTSGDSEPTRGEQDDHERVREIHQFGQAGLDEVRFLMGAVDSERCDLSLLVEELRLLGREKLTPQGIDFAIATDHQDVILPFAIFLALQGVFQGFWVELGARKRLGRCSLRVEPNQGDLLVSVGWENRDQNAVVGGDVFHTLETAAASNGWFFERGEGHSCRLRICNGGV